MITLDKVKRDYEEHPYTSTPLERVWRLIKREEKEQSQKSEEKEAAEKVKIPSHNERIASW